ncbi:hypothetical protein TI04_10910 [Achromatium sp. WMS2]|nr:hypothetical protein TI04_10910 [Achromatium sp. WMS2]
MVSIPAGSFMMGSPESEAGRDSDEGPQHRVTVKAFQMAKYETTFAEYDAFCEATGRAKPDDRGWGRGNRPVINVTWDDAVAYTKWLSQQTGKDYRLPTEAQWEYAARAGSTSRYFFGDDANRLGDYAWYDGNSNSKTHPVGQKQPNAWGLYDVHGNVWEWTQDRWHDNYNGAPTDGSAWESGNSSRRILRGGSWSSNDGNCRTAYRGNDEHSSSSSYWGFRVACVLG